MADIAERLDERALRRNVVGPLLAAAMLDVASTYFGFDPSPQASSPGAFLPAMPDWLMSGVWICLCAMQGSARWRLGDAVGPDGRRVQGLLCAQIVLCCVASWCRPGQGGTTVALALLPVAIVLATLVSARMWQLNRIAMVAPVAVIVWVCFTGFSVADQRRWWW